MQRFDDERRIENCNFPADTTLYRKLLQLYWVTESTLYWESLGLNWASCGMDLKLDIKELTIR